VNKPNRWIGNLSVRSFTRADRVQKARRDFLPVMQSPDSALRARREPERDRLDRPIEKWRRYAGASYRSSWQGGSSLQYMRAAATRKGTARGRTTPKSPTSRATVGHSAWRDECSGVRFGHFEYEGTNVRKILPGLGVIEVAPMRLAELVHANRCLGPVISGSVRPSSR
jgi:hypothetical protein